MFSNQLPDSEDYRVMVGAYCTRHYIKRFAKDYSGKRWAVTLSSIEKDLRHIYYLQDTQQVDKLKRGTGCLLLKYDFTIAQSGVSPKASGNRCIIFLDFVSHQLTILLLYGKNDLPKNQPETAWIFDTVKSEYAALWQRLN